MEDDPIVAEVRQLRAAILESYDWDFDKMSRDVMQRQWNSGRKIVSRRRKPSEEGATPDRHSAGDR